MIQHHTPSADDPAGSAATAGRPIPPNEHLLVTAAPALRRCWHAVAFDHAVESTPVARRLLGVDIVLWRSPAGEVVAAVDRCPHRWAKLSTGINREGQLVCPYHGWTFDETGRATLVPQLPAGAAIPPMACLPMLPCRSNLGLVWVSLEHDPVTEVPTVPEHTDPQYRAIEVGVIDYHCSAAAVVDNNTDATHVAFVHASSFGAGQDPRVPPGRARRAPFGVVIESDPMAVASAPSGAVATQRTTTTEMWLPFAQVSRMRYPDGLVHILVKGCCPIDDARTAVHLTVLRNDVDADDPADPQAIVDFELAIEHEDAAVLKTLPREFPLDVRAQCHLRHDRGGIEYRRALAELLGRFG
jgi:phenylpropionate dioxygenase-like ring-hydroxylating dioxygenase large terminal subunit